MLSLKGKLKSYDALILTKLIRGDVTSAHIIFNFEVIVKKKDWHLERNTTFDIAMAFHISNFGDILFQLKYQILRLVLIIIIIIISTQ